MTSLNAKQFKDYDDRGYVAPINILSLEKTTKIFYNNSKKMGKY